MGLSAIAFGEEYNVPKELTTDEIERIIQKVSNGTNRDISANFDATGLHREYVYLLCHLFLE